MFVDYQMSISPSLFAHLRELVEHCNRSIASSSAEGGLTNMLLLIASFLISERERERERGGEKGEVRKERKKEMTIILLEAYKQRPCIYIHTQTNAKALQQWI